MMYENSGPRVLSHEQAEVYRKHGSKAADLHVHTLCSRDVFSDRSLHPETLYSRARERGMDYVTFTDRRYHESLRSIE